MESGIYLMVHKSGLLGPLVPQDGPTPRPHASDGERTHTAPKAPPAPRPSQSLRPSPPWGCADSHGTMGG